MTNTATQLSAEHQISVLMILGASLTNNIGFKAVVNKLEQSSEDPAEKAGWDAVKVKVEGGADAHVALAESGLFTPMVNRMFVVIGDFETASQTAIDFLSICALTPK
ncbi:hypothetical protein [Pseudomonas syringae]|uniref:hypothetical protein n=1 Tax=Pseudomonas syringae TaxID=317 RepID=UPI001F1DF353|nr:hypothetical protein [Pseudomonas syringae]MCF5371921.1 hypothetical protein [Pseudomonas syringae]MCF5382497.1 hypothetical protein [Pseudomonas syringae]MCF5419384.1 hypothetical protein [Pseudomonas syringae]MCF5451931.1 hypothetical protein [Pseudomonas syringae]MCF5460264.1 hypothetical protein [Pseudomonas syringae]